MKKIICMLLAVVVCMSIFTGCQKKDAAKNDEQDNVVQNEQEEKEPNMLDGKKIIFIGNSFTYYGETVLEKVPTILEQSQRINDEGFFYQLCKANGAEVAVTNWTFAAHSLEDLFGGNCQADRGCDGVDHKSYLVDKQYDYVVIQEGTRGSATTDVLENCRPVMEFFREANPDAKFVFLAHHNVHRNQYAWRSTMKNLESENVTVVDWGALICDILYYGTEVPGADLEYNENTFIISKSESDGYHPNPLTGYITTLMTYCAITGESAVGQDYSFVEDKVTFTNFKNKYYTYNPQTNFDEVFNSESDMRGLQTLIDQYLEAKSYRNY